MDQLLIQSLNVPSVRLLNAYGVHDFYDFLKESGLQGLFRPPDGYGLSLILGGAEASLFELVQLYLSLANLGKVKPLRLFTNDGIVAGSAGNRLISEGSAWLVINALRDLARPGIDYYWNRFDNQIPVAWKTGTSYGQKDAWAIGFNRQWIVGVWVGNFTGEGNAALSGAQSAAPLMFDLFSTLTRPGEPMWFEEPWYDLNDVECCAESGYPAGPDCIETTVLSTPSVAFVAGSCPFHRRYLVEKSTGKSVCSLCWNQRETTWIRRYILPPRAKEILAKSGYSVESAPSHLAECPGFQGENHIELVYPVNGLKILIPRDLDGEYEKVVFTAKHQRSATHLFWYLNGSLLGETVDDHRFAVDLQPGAHRLAVQDEEGFTRTVFFRAYKKES